MQEKFNSENAEELRRYAEEYAQKAGIKLNPDKKIVEGLIKGLLKNKETRGEIYCPCRVITGDKKKDRDIICPCVFHKGEIKAEGHCKCFLFVA
ncbi:ferredoxin:thioredoxin reductase [Candidatus Pacearchaeota archaeon]|nr:ferredoxin:thioredoxin reductase [Candidatus Pacearchaeota archaeon]